jgi:hypothetical protein
VIFIAREIPADARKFIVTDGQGLPYRAIELDGKRFDEEGWRLYLDNEIPANHQELPE